MPHRWNAIFRVISEKRVTDTVTSLGTVVPAVSVVVSAWGIMREGEHQRVERALKILETFDKEAASNVEGGEMLEAFPGRWDPDIKEPLSREDALKFLNISAERYIKNDVSRKYNLARRHLNRLADIAFAYVHGAADRKLLEASSCVFLARSNYYFQHLIKVFGEELGPSQAWQVIPQAAAEMRRAHGPLCRVNLKQKPPS